MARGASETPRREGAPQPSRPRRARRVAAGVLAVLVAGGSAVGGYMLAEHNRAVGFDPVAAWERIWEPLQPGGGALPGADADVSADIRALARAYAGADEAIVGDGLPDFTDDELLAATSSFEAYGPLDGLGRCTVCVASVGPDTLPGAERTSIGAVQPSGWQTARYDDLIEDHYLFNRCHLVAYVLTAENARAENLVTGTAHLNRALMLPHEVAVARYVEKSGNHVLYRATPIFVDDELVCRAVRLEACSVEDGGEGIGFDVLLYNVQPGVVIDYATGASRRAQEGDPTWRVVAAPPEVAESLDVSDASGRRAVSVDATSAADGLGAAGVSGYSRDGLVLPHRTSLAKGKFVVNVNSSKFHSLACTWATDMAPRNAWPTDASYSDLVDAGFVPCASCL